MSGMSVRNTVGGTVELLFGETRILLSRDDAIQLQSHLIGTLNEPDAKEAIDRFSVEKQIAYVFDGLKRTNVRVAELEEKMQRMFAVTNDHEIKFNRLWLATHADEEQK